MGSNPHYAWHSLSHQNTPPPSHTRRGIWPFNTLTYPGPCRKTYPAGLLSPNWHLRLGSAPVRGISSLWGKAHQQASMQAHKVVNPSTWSSQLIQIALQYSLSLWKYPCNMNYGGTEVFQQKLKLEKLHHAVSSTYQAFAKDKFIISRNLSHIFNCPLERRLKQDHDSLTSYIRAGKTKNFFKWHPSAKTLLTCSTHLEPNVQPKYQPTTIVKQIPESVRGKLHWSTWQHL